MIFSTKLNKKNIKLRDYLLNKISKHIESDKFDILDMGCGNGRFAILFDSKIKSYVGIDPNEEYLEVAKKTIPKEINAEYYKGRAEEVPIKNKKFDVVIYTFSWHFLSDFNKAIIEAERLLKENGIIVILEPSKNNSNWASPKLREDSGEFDEKLYQKKLRDLNEGRIALYNLDKNKISIVDEEVDRKDLPNLWILKINEDNKLK